MIPRIILLSSADFKMRAHAKGTTTALLILLTVILGKASAETKETHRRREPFFDILDVPPELRNVPETPTIYDLLSIPSMEGPLRISFAPERPSHNPDLPPSGFTWKGYSQDYMPEPPLSIFKRDRSPPLRACPVKNEWVHIQTATDIFNTEVEVSQVQWFWQTTCLQVNQACYGFPSLEEGVTSECRETNSWVMAWAREIDGEENYSWRHVAVPTCCSCAVIDPQR